MKTKTFRALRSVAHLCNLIAIAVSVVYIFYALINVKMLILEHIIMKESLQTVYNSMKIMIFLNILGCMLSSYSLNISSKAVMGLCVAICLGIEALGIYFAFYLHKYYPAYFKNVLDSKIYVNREVFLSLETYLPTSGVLESKDECIKQMKSLIISFIVYEEICFVAILATSIILKLSKYVKITEEESCVPVISEYSKVGLNTVSLRSKRVVAVSHTK
jgi:hypothetical protein